SSAFDNRMNESVDLYQDNDYTVQISSTYSLLKDAQKVSIWIDLNNNGLFETGTESILLAAAMGNGFSTNFSLSIPANAGLGLHRMRAQLVRAQPSDPCNANHTDGYAETHDYSVNVLQGYCIPAAGDGCSMGAAINDFILMGERGTGINDTSTGCVGASAYDNRRKETVLLYTGIQYVVQISSLSSGGVSVAIWIDFDDNRIFAVNEAVLNTVTLNGTGRNHFQITIPSNAQPGGHRMRVKLQYSIYNPRVG
ncbi:unnamed protein product, partial [Didymodactylos carnosus]